MNIYPGGPIYAKTSDKLRIQGTATCFLYNTTTKKVYLVTIRHCVDMPNLTDVLDADFKSFAVQDNIFLIEPVKEEGDVAALIEITNKATLAKWNFCLLGDEWSMEPNTISHGDMAHKNIFCCGSMTPERIINGTVEYDYGRYITLNCAILPGDSGSPCIKKASNEIIAIIGHATDTNLGSGYKLEYVVQKLAQLGKGTFTLATWENREQWTS